jgi:hypothetical protein
MRRGAKLHLTTEQIDEARRLADYGWSYARIGERLGFGYGTIRLALDADYRGSRRIGAHETRQRRYKPDKRISKTNRENATSVDVKADAAARLAEVPPDDRSLTARMFGDPLRGRSALDKRQHS